MKTPSAWIIGVFNSAASVVDRVLTAAVAGTAPGADSTTLSVHRSSVAFGVLMDLITLYCLFGPRVKEYHRERGPQTGSTVRPPRRPSG